MGEVIKTKAAHGAYAVWRSINQKCSDLNGSDYKYYAGKGIKVCDDWLSFHNFLKDVGERPADHRLLRINKEGDFEPDNCEWVPVRVKRRKENEL